METTLIAGGIAALFSFLAYVPFLIAIFRKKVKPNRATWFIWSLVSYVIAVSYYQAGARDTALVPAVYGICSSVIFLLSIKYGVGGWTRFDRKCVIVSLAGIVLWILSSTPIVALFLNMGVDLTGGIPTIRKIFEDPSSEDRLTWIFFWLGSVANVAAIDQWIFIIAAYPVVMMLFISFVTALIVFLPRKLEETNQ
ncbi:MAG: hypothetical protein V1696_03040 [Candidatus Jorgensenbacteria bacterium]